MSLHLYTISKAVDEEGNIIEPNTEGSETLIWYVRTLTPMSGRG